MAVSLEDLAKQVVEGSLVIGLGGSTPRSLFAVRVDATRDPCIQ